MEVFYLRNGDIPQYMRDGVVDLAILGENLLVEKGEDLQVIEQLGFSKCRVSIAVPKNIAFNGAQDLEGKRIATSYPNTVNAFLEAPIGPKPMNAGGHPLIAVDLILAIIGSLFDLAYSSSHTKVAEAPSVKGEAVPAVTVPF